MVEISKVNHASSFFLFFFLIVIPLKGLIFARSINGTKSHIESWFLIATKCENKTKFKRYKNKAR